MAPALEPTPAPKILNPLTNHDLQYYHADVTRWGREVDLSAEVTESIVNMWLLNRMELYTQQEYGDEDLWGVYREDFEGWTKETFLKGDKHLVRIFRDYLRS